MMSKLKTNQGCIRSNDLKTDSLESKNITVWLGKEKKVRNQFVVWVKTNLCMYLLFHIHN